MTKSTTLKTFSMAAAGAAFMMLGTIGSAEAASFTGVYDPSNWTLTNNNADGFVDTTNAPFSVSITGGDNESGWFGETLYTTTAVSSGLFSFDWSYITQDTFKDSFWDPFGFILNETFTQLTIDGVGDISQFGTFSTMLTAGDIFGFVVQTRDNNYFPATVTISNLSPQSVPEPTATLGFLMLGGMGAGSILKRKKNQEKVTVKS